MNFKHIIKEIENADQDQLTDRRELFKSFGSKVALAALPFAVGSLFQKASAQTTDTVVKALNRTLELEYLQYNFYRTANNTGNLIPPAGGNANNDKPGFLAIEGQELAHINLLKSTITSLKGVPFTPKGYDATASNPAYVPEAYNFTAAGTVYASTFVNVFNDYEVFLTAAQIFEDTAIHAIQGQMKTYLSNIPVFKMMMQLQATEARQAAYGRLMRRLPPINATDQPAPWITANIPPRIALQAFYNTEDNVSQMNVDISAIEGATPGTTIQRLSATAAFDEAFDAATVNSLMAPFKL